MPNGTGGRSGSRNRLTCLPAPSDRWDAGRSESISPCRWPDSPGNGNRVKCQIRKIWGDRPDRVGGSSRTLWPLVAGHTRADHLRHDLARAQLDLAGHWRRRLRGGGGWGGRGGWARSSRSAAKSRGGATRPSWSEAEVPSVRAVIPTCVGTAAGHHNPGASGIGPPAAGKTVYKGRSRGPRPYRAVGHRPDRRPVGMLPLRTTAQVKASHGNTEHWEALGMADAQGGGRGPGQSPRRPAQRCLTPAAAALCASAPPARPPYHRRSADQQE